MKFFRVLWCFVRNHYGLNGREFMVRAGIIQPCKWCGN